MKFKIFTTDEFNKIFNKLDFQIRNQIEKEIDQLSR